MIERAWMVWCPPSDECDYRVYFTRCDAEIADEQFREDCLTDEEDAERRTQGVIPLVALPDVATLRQQLATAREALTRLRDCDWVITLPDRMDAVRDIARTALAKMEEQR